MDSEGNFIGKEDGSVSISGNEEIANKEDLDKAITVDEFNKKTREQKIAQMKEEISKNETKIAINESKITELEVESNDYVNSRAKVIADEFNELFKDDFIALDKYKYEWGFVLGKKDIEYDYVDRYDDSELFVKKGSLSPTGNTTGSERPLSKKFEYIKGNTITRAASQSIYHSIFKQDSIHINFTYMNETLQPYIVEGDFWGTRFMPTKTSKYITNSKLIERMEAALKEIKNKYYYEDKEKLDSLYSQAKLLNEDSEQLTMQNAKLKGLIARENKEYAKIMQAPITPKTIEIIEDNSVWEGNSTWERHSKDGYIKTLIQNGEEIAKRVQHPLVGIKRVGTKTEEVRERREVESSTYDVIEKPTDNKDENGKVIQEGSDGLVEKSL